MTWRSYELLMGLSDNFDLLKSRFRFESIPWQIFSQSISLEEINTFSRCFVELHQTHLHEYLHWQFEQHFDNI